MKAKEFARIGQIRQGDVLTPDNDFGCMPEGSLHTVMRDEHGLYIKCSDGNHYLSGQEDGHYYVGLYKVE